MKVTVKDFLHVRVGKPSVNAPTFQHVAPGTVLDIDGKLYKGDRFEGIDTWLKDEAGNFYWSGGVESEATRNGLLSNFSNFWWLNDYGIQDLWASGLTGQGIRIAVLDTGIFFPHPDLQLDPNLFGDITGSASGIRDLDGHGTHCVGIIKGFNTQSGPFGVAHNSTVCVCKITHDEAGDDDSFLIKGIDWAITKNVDLISISKGSAHANTLVEDAIKKAEAKGILIIAAAGNRVAGIPDDHIYFPARYKSTLSVGGVDDLKRPLTDSILTGESNLFAPGKQILSTHLNGGLINRSGSSQAAPFVAGICALLLQHQRSTNSMFQAVQLKSMLLDHADVSGNIKLVNIKRLLNLTLA